MRISAIILMLLVTSVPAIAASDPLAWPAATMQNKPWARWWWLGSAVDKENLTALLENYQAAGFGGVEICPIYGAKGYEDRYIDFLSPKWMEMLAHTTREAKRLGMAIDLTTGTGWPFGGPMVTADDASGRVVMKCYDFAGGGKFDQRLPEGKLQCLRAVADDKQIDLMIDRDQVLPAGKWRIYAVAEIAPIQKVKRAAPGGAGNVLDPYSVAAMDQYTAAFDKAFEHFDAPMPRAEFHDSFEYYGASWTSDFFDEFQRRRGYDLRTQLPALFGDADIVAWPPRPSTGGVSRSAEALGQDAQATAEDIIARVKHDYRETISDLHLAYIRRWCEWAHAHGSLSRNQAHGAPGNLIDLYAAADIPETEIFKEPDERSIPLHKFASSAAHLTGRSLASSESFTWLGEHFQVSLADCKPAADFLFLAGINHIFYHGVPYSPNDVAWPGWLFYASVNFGPDGGLWHDLPQLNAYIARVQSILQAGKSDNDVLLYWPVHDTWQTKDGLLEQFTVHDQEKWLCKTPFYDVATKLLKRGYAFDEVSDALLADAKCADGRIDIGGSSYRTMVVPKCRLMPVETMQKLVELADAGATVIVEGAVPSDVPGLANLENRRQQLRELKSDRFHVAADVVSALADAKVPRESIMESGLHSVRRSRDDGHDYFIVNRGDRPFDGWASLATPAKAAAILDPRFTDRAGVAIVRDSRVYLQLQPGESCVVRTFDHLDGKPWQYLKTSGGDVALTGTWHVHFLEGGPVLPADFDSDRFASWTQLGDAEAKRFAGTARYTIEFDAVGGNADDWLLDLGRVCESARVTINDKPVATAWCQPFQLHVGKFLKPGRNILAVEVTNLAANRIADLDRRGVNWKSFHEINFVNRDYKPFDASHWPPRDSGLLGPVRLVPLRRFDPTAMK